MLCACVCCFSLSLSLLILNFDLSRLVQAALFCVEFAPKMRERNFPHATKEDKTQNNVKLNVFVWKTERRFEDRASVAEKKKERQRVQLFFVFFVFLRSEERYCFLRFVVR